MKKAILFLFLGFFSFSPALFALDGDVNHDGKVDLVDLNLVRTHFGETTSEGDANGDGRVDLTDLNLVRTNFGTQEPPGPALLGDADRNGVVDLNDMNLVRSHMGETGSVGDATGDGKVDLADLNAVRNNFGARLTTRPPTITQVQPATGSRYYPPGNVQLRVTAQDPDGDTLQYRFLLNGQVIRDWNSSNTHRLSFNALPAGLKTIRMEVRDPSQAQAAQEIQIYLFAKPLKARES